MTDRSCLVAGHDLHRTFQTGAGPVYAVAGVDIDVHAGRLTVVRGPSGSGKTTLLNLLGGLDRPTSGAVVLGDGRTLSDLAEEEVLEVRRTVIGYVFQSFGLIPVLSAAENVEVPLRLLRVPAQERSARVAEALDLVGLSGHSRQRPYELSGGQQQRVGIARALVARPQILIADEPTGQLDSDTAATIMDLLVTVVRDQGIAAVISTHDPVLAQRAHVVIDLHDGRRVEASAAGHPDEAP